MARKKAISGEVCEKADETANVSDRKSDTKSGGKGEVVGNDTACDCGGRLSSVSGKCGGLECDSTKTVGDADGKKPLEAAVRQVIACDVPSDMTELFKLLEAAGLKPTNSNGIALAIALKALKGDLSAANWIRDILGEKGKESAKASAPAMVVIGGEEQLAE